MSSDMENASRLVGANYGQEIFLLLKVASL
jgi:hypothetical protein